jgi:uncharacterized delta-60 repeat protein
VLAKAYLLDSLRWTDNQAQPRICPGAIPQHLAGGKLLIAGDFNQVSGTPRSQVARLNSDGTLDPSFDPGLIQGIPGRTGSSVGAVAIQSDGKILIGGAFYEIQGSNVRRSIARLNSDGSLDPDFAPQLFANTWVGWLPWISSIIVQPDDKVVIAGTFYTQEVETGTRSNLIRLNTDGTVDTTFSAPAGTENIDAITESDGKFLLAAQFTTNNVGRIAFVRLESDGRVDPGFHPLPTTLSSIAVQADGKILIATPSEWTGIIHPIARLNSNGSLDSSFDPGSGINDFLGSWGPPCVCAIALLPDEKILIGGRFTKLGVTSRTAVARLDSQGTIDPSFNAGTIDGRPWDTPWVNTILRQPDGKLLIIGGFTFIKPASDVTTSIGEVRHGLKNPILLPDGRFQFVLFGPTGCEYTIQTSTDLLTWSDWESVTGDNEGLTIQHQMAAGHPTRFYRVILREGGSR